MAKSNKSKRFIQQSKDSINKHDERFPYQMTYSDSEERKSEEVDKFSLGGF
ncbi:hypothetical protein LC087_01460 [Bacillus carboniphilus]|uniref:Competence protein n=1 Tax=Bacillus carboniphilus TaxID=86663 RepID=A0ABY9JU64_9BACI|nr:hypothetical protein [Bacillus carboniphilus]WLR42925.1 hypothetical protein LC087_01460 [Bacillus carboniphilus]